MSGTNSSAVDSVRPSAPRFGTFAGLVDGIVGDEAGLRRAAARLGAVPSELIVDGGRFTLHFDDRRVPGARLDVDAQDALVDALNELAQAAAPGRPLESTLRGTLVYEDRVVETLFVVDAEGGIEPVSRERERTAADDAHGRKGAAPRQSRGRRSFLLGLIALAGGLAAWQAGLVGWARGVVAQRGADEIRRGTGPFGDMLAVELEGDWLGWTVSIGRGPGYPATPTDAEARASAAATNAERAASRAAPEGGRAWLRSLDANGAALGARPVDLMELVTREDARVRITLPRNVDVAAFELALTAGEVR